MSENNPLGFTPAGWYADPSGSMRWWDGNGWSQHLVGHTGPAPLPKVAGGHVGRWVALIIALVVIAIIVPAAGLAAYVLNESPEDATPARLAASVAASPSASSAVATGRTAGTVVFSDTFADASSGWIATTLASGSTFRYAAGGYEILSKGNLEHFAYTPSPSGRRA